MELDYTQLYIYFKMFFFPFMAFIIAFMVFYAYTRSHFDRNVLDVDLMPLGREKEVTRLADYILTGQSSAIVGIFDAERTEILNVLQDKRQFHFLYGKKASSFIFSYVDISTLNKDDVTPKDFWERVLMPLSEVEIESVANLYKKCIENDYKEYYLSSLVKGLGNNNLCFILLIDKFDLLHKNTQNFKTDFFATLRALSSNSPERALTTILTMGITTNQFIQLEMGKGVTGSSLVSYVDAHEIILASIEDNKLLELMKKRAVFASLDQKILQEIVSLIGGHPYLVKFVEDYLRQHEDELLNQQNNIVKNIEKELKDKLQSILKADFVKDGKFTTLEKVIDSDIETTPTVKKELERLGLFKKDKLLPILAKPV